MTPELPNLYLADLGPGLELTPQTVRDACFAIRRNREQWLLKKRTRELIDMVAYTAEQWLDPDFGFRRRALQASPAETGFPPATLARGLDAFFKCLTPEQLESLVAHDLGDARKLDEFSATSIEARQGRSSMARGPELLAHVCAGNLPVPAMMSLVLGVLTKSAQFFKLPQQGGLVPRLFAHSLAATESKLGACFEMARWPGGTRALEDALFSEANCVTATGGDALLSELRGRMPLATRFAGYGHKFSFGFVPVEALTSYSMKRTARDAAADITAWNQLGCLSPHVLYVEDNGVHSPEGLAEQLAKELAAREVTEPRGEIPVEDAAAIAGRRSVYAMRSVIAPPARERKLDSVFVEVHTSLRLWQSGESTAWTVVLDTDPRFAASCLNRFIYIKPIKRLADALHYADEIRDKVSTVALGQAGDRTAELSLELARWGVPRICPLGRMQEPPLTWRHDGRPSLADLVEWTDLET